MINTASQFIGIYYIIPGMKRECVVLLTSCDQSAVIQGFDVLKMLDF